MSFVNERTVKAVRKRHLCSACDKFIEVGEAAVSWAGISDGFQSAYFHPECREAEVAYNQGVLGWRGGDDWWPLHEIESDDRPWLQEQHPVAYARVCRTRAEQEQAA